MMSNPLKKVSLKNWCESNGYNGVTQECIRSAFQSQDKKVQSMAKKQMIKGMSYGKEEEKR